MKKLLVCLLFLCVSFSVHAENDQWTPTFHALGNRLLYKESSQKIFLSKEGPLVVTGDFFIPKLNDKFTAKVIWSECWDGHGTIVIHGRKIKWTDLGDNVSPQDNLTDRIAQILCDWMKLQPNEED